MEDIATKSLVRAPHVRETFNHDGAVLLDPRRGQCYPLNPVAALIWKQLGEGCTPLQIAENVATVCNISLETANFDVFEFVRLVLSAQLAFPQKPMEPTSSRLGWWKGLRNRLWHRAEKAV